MQFQRANTTAQKFKIIFRGETKRIPPARDYIHLYALAGSSFREQLAASNCQSRKFKFYYLDEDNELISICSQSDFECAMSLEMPGSLRLIVEFDQNAARQQLMDHLENTQNMSQLIRGENGLNDSQMFDRQSTIMSTKNGPFLRQDSPFAEFSEQIQQAPNTCRAPIRQPIELSQSMIPVDNKPEIKQNVADIMPKLNMDEVLKDAFKNTGVNTNLVSTNATGTQSKPVMKDQEIGQINDKDLYSDSNESLEEVDGPLSDAQVPCFKCKGTKINKKGNPCKKCNGTGYFTGFPAAIADSIRVQVSAYLESSGNFKQMIDEYVATRKQQQDAVVHNEFECDVCDASPITGIRYMCTVCNNYDICQKCEAAGKGCEHPKLKIRNPKHAPARIVCQYNNFGQSQMGDSMARLNLNKPCQAQQPFVPQNVQQTAPQAAPAQVAPQTAPAPKEKYLARFVKDSHGDGLKVEPGQKFPVSWTFRNTGKTAWPQGTVFMHTSGDDLGVGQSAMVPNDVTVQPEQEYTFELELTAPAKTGRYTSFYRLQHNEARFGQKVWADIRVVEPVIPEKVPQMVPQNLPASVQEEAVPLLATPKQIYLEQLEKKQVSDDIKQKMVTLFDFGFVEFETNLEQLNKHKGNLEVVAGFLSDQLLSKSYY